MISVLNLIHITIVCFGDLYKRLPLYIMSENFTIFVVEKYDIKFTSRLFHLKYKIE